MLQVVKRNVIENIVPIVVALKRKLATNKSPLMGNLMHFLRELMKDYKDEIKDILAEDRQLMAEIDFDLKRFEQQEKLDANLQTGNRTNRSVPPPELISANANETTRPQQADRRSRISERLLQPPEVSDDSVTHKDANVEKSVDDALANKTTESDPASTGHQESQVALADGREISASKVNGQQQEERMDVDQVEEDEIEDSLPSLESTRIQPQMLPPKRTSARLRHQNLRSISTPIRNIPTDEVSFQMRDLDLSEIPQLDTRKRKRK